MLCALRSKLLAFLFLLLFSSSVLANLPTHAVVLAGHPISGHDLFNAFKPGTKIAINNAGQVLFEGRDESDGNLWLAQPDGTLSMLHHFGDPAPGLPGTFLGMADRSFIHWYLNDLGQTTVSGPTGPVFGQDSGEKIAWIGTAGSMTIAARQSAPPPGFVGTVTGVRALHLNDSGDVVVWYETNPIVGTGFLAAGAPGDLKILAQNVGSTQPVMIDNAGNVAFLTVESGIFKIWYGPPSNPRLIAQGDSSFANPVLSKNGRIAFGGRIPSGPRALFVGAPGADPIPVLRDGDPAPGLPGQIIDAPINISINDAGYVAFEASANGRHGYWAGRPGSFRAVALDGDPAPADIPGLVFRGLTNQLTFVNNSGELLFQGTYLDPITSQNAQGLWATDLAGSLHLIARDGGQLQFDGQTRTISQVGIRFGLNDSGQVAFTAAFTDGSSGVFLATIPEPASAILFIPIFFLTRRRR